MAKRKADNYEINTTESEKAAKRQSKSTNKVEVDQPASDLNGPPVLKSKNRVCSLVKSLAKVVGSSDTSLDKETLDQCRALLDALNSKRTPDSDKESLHQLDYPTEVAQIAPPGELVSSIYIPTALTPWTLAGISSRTPPLPAINDSVLEAATFTHTAFTAQGKSMSYERLEWVGDAYLYLISTLLISKTFHSLSPGRCAQIRELLVKNETLAQYARQYNFELRAKLPPEYRQDQPLKPKVKDRERTKVLGDIFEAYVAAVVLSDLQHGVDRVSTWLKDLWAGTIRDKIKIQEQEDGERSMGTLDTDPKAKLQKTIVTRGVKLHYRDSSNPTKDPVTGFLIYNVGVYLDGWGEQGRELGVGSALKKKEASVLAARAALKNRGLIDFYQSKKKTFDAQIQAERQAGEGIVSGTGGQSQEKAGEGVR